MIYGSNWIRIRIRNTVWNKALKGLSTLEGLPRVRQEGVGGVHEQPRAGPPLPSLRPPSLDPGHTLSHTQAQALQLRVVQPQRSELNERWLRLGGVSEYG